MVLARPGEPLTRGLLNKIFGPTFASEEVEAGDGTRMGTRSGEAWWPWLGFGFYLPGESNVDAKGKGREEVVRTMHICRRQDLVDGAGSRVVSRPRGREGDLERVVVKVSQIMVDAV